jgi:hypothetical protein
MPPFATKLFEFPGKLLALLVLPLGKLFLHCLSLSAITEESNIDARPTFEH